MGRAGPGRGLGGAGCWSSAGVGRERVSVTWRSGPGAGHVIRRSDTEPHHVVRRRAGALSRRWLRRFVPRVLRAAAEAARPGGGGRDDAAARVLGGRRCALPASGKLNMAPWQC